jgi:hypothetical protein
MKIVQFQITEHERTISDDKKYYQSAMYILTDKGKMYRRWLTPSLEVWAEVKMFNLEKTKNIKGTKK